MNARLLSIVVAMTAVLWLGHAQGASLKELAQRLFPQTEVDAVEPTPIPGLHEIRSGRSILYMDQTGRYVVIGELYDFTGRKNLTAERLLGLSSVRFDDLPLESAIRMGPKQGAKRLAIFDDVDCPFCRRFHEEVLPAVLKEGVTVYVFLHPLTTLHSQAQAKSEAIWCSDDRVAALAAAFNGVLPQEKRAPCPTPIASIRALATKLGITGTPTIILDTGARIEGFIDHEALKAKWQGSARRSTTPP